jgi:hypothetical protein
LVDTHDAVWLVIVPPLFAPTPNVTTREPKTVVVGVGLATTPVGAAGVPTITGDDVADPAPGPPVPIATTRHEYDLELVSPPTVIWVAGAGVSALPTAPPSLDAHVAV